jgi:hypothetical protein
VRTFLVAVIAALSLLIVPSASAQQYNHYINCGTGAYMFSYDLYQACPYCHWQVINVERHQIWGSC